MQKLIEVHHLKKAFDEIIAVKDISMGIDRGEVLGFLGPNGAGKSTTMKMIAGFLYPTSGSVSVCGIDVLQNPIEAKKRIGYLPEGAPSYEEMICLDFLKFVAQARGISSADIKQKIYEAAEKTALTDVLHRPIETFSKGYKRRVGLAQAILHDPDVLILDEPTDGLDPNQKKHVRELIKTMSEDKAIIISTHILEEVEAICSRSIIINRGEIVANATAEELLGKLPFHNAVRITVPKEQVSQIKQGIEKLDSHGGVEIGQQYEDVCELNVLSKQGYSPIKEVSRYINEQHVEVKEMGIIHGKLDEVFHILTKEREEKEVVHA